MSVLPPDECHVWWADLGQCARWHAGLLDPIESGRLRGYRKAADRGRFTVGVALTRLVLGAHLGVSPRAVAIDRSCRRCGGPHGRPRLSAGPAIDFSVSHSGDVIGLAVTRSPGPSRRVGLDVERQDGTTAADAPVDVALAAAEQRSYRALDAAAQPAAFFRYWVRKEALLKATGDGLAVPMTHLTMSAPGQPARLLHWQGRPGYPALVSLHDLRARPGYLAALALIGGDAAVICHDAADVLDDQAALAR